MGPSKFIKVVFFDLGNTLVGSQRNWLPGAPETLQKLRARHIRLGIISDTDGLETRQEILSLLPPDFDLKLFADELVIFSSEVGISKPDPEIFRLAVKLSGVNPEECLFCTEEPAHIEAAKNEKLKTIQLKKPPQSDIKDLLPKMIGAGFIPA